jgi:anti-anti-sigma factor
MKMDVQDWPQGIILVNLSRRLQKHDELQRAIETVQKQHDCNVVVDFSYTDVVSCATLARLLKMRLLLQGRAHKLVLCSVAPAAKDVFTITRLDQVFVFVKDKFAALAIFKGIR